MSTTETPVQAPPKRLYKSTVKFGNVIMPEGRILHFKAGMYITADQEEIDYLDRAIAKNEYRGQIFIDPNARTITAEQENPLLALRKKFFEEFMEEQRRMLNPENDMGTSEQGKLNAASTTSIAPTAAGGDGAARLIPVAKNLTAPAATK